MNIIIKRFNKFNESIDGYLFINHLPVCATAEHILCALPVGTYPLNFEYDEELKCKLPFIGDTGIMIHPRSGIYGEPTPYIVVGDRIVAGCMKHTEEVYDHIISRIEKCERHNEPVTITILENFFKRSSALIPKKRY